MYVYLLLRLCRKIIPRFHINVQKNVITLFESLIRNHTGHLATLQKSIIHCNFLCEYKKAKFFESSLRVLF